MQLSDLSFVYTETISFRVFNAILTLAIRLYMKRKVKLRASATVAELYQVIKT